MAAIWGRVQALLTGAALSRASSDAVTPVLEPVRQHAWQKNQLRVLSPNEAAQLVAQGALDAASAHEEGSRSGVNANRVNALIHLAQVAPTVGEAFMLHRRGKIDDAQLHHAYAKAKIEPDYWPALDNLLAELLSPGELAAAIHRGLVPNPNILLGEQPQPPFTVEAYPVQPIDPVAEAAASGFNKERLAVLVGLQGLPMGTHEAAEAYFRGIITHGDYIRAFNESNSRNEWAEAVLGYTRQIPTARDFLENALRGYRNLTEAIKGAALHGMSAEHATLIYQNQGRPMTVKLITQALARGGKFKPEPGELTDPYEASIVEGSIKPAYYDLQKALRYNYPSAFVLRALVQSGDISQAEAEQVLLYEGWEPTFAAKVSAAWGGAAHGQLGKAETAATLRAEYEGYYLTEAELRAALTALGYVGATIDREVHLGNAARVKSYRDKAEDAAHKAYISGGIQEAQARSTLSALHVDPAGLDSIIAVWNIEKGTTRKTLTPAQVKAAYKRNTLTLAEATADLENHGYSAGDAATYLQS